MVIMNIVRESRRCNKRI